MPNPVKKIALLGSTGSVGISALKIVEANPDRYRIVGLAAGRNTRILSAQMEAFRPRCVAVADPMDAAELERRFSGEYSPRVLSGTGGLIEVATLEDTDTVISAMSGAAGLLPTFEAVRARKRIALANKETMVMAGGLIMDTALRNGVSILPVDSEHSAIFQCLQGHPKEDVKRVILTASGGPFRAYSIDQMRGVNPRQALAHPNWSMGPKISIDSATMMNKGLEAIEAKWLFGLRMEQIGILIHPQSIVHSLVEYSDGSFMAQMGIPDMRIPVSYALSYPRHVGNTLEPLELDKIGTLTFEKPDLERFPCIRLALDAAETGGSAPAVLNGANEIAVAAFLNGKIGFLDIARVIEKTLRMHRAVAVETIEGVLEADRWSRDTAKGLLGESVC